MKKYLNHVLKIASVTSLVVLTLGCSSQSMKSGEQVQQSKYDYNNRKVETFNVDDHTEAELRIVKMFHLRIPKEEAYSLIVNKIPDWFSSIPKVEYYESEINVGATITDNSTARVCESEDGLIVEKIVGNSESTFLAYSVDMDKSTVGIPMEDHLGVMTVEDGANGGSIVTWRQYYNRKFHIMAPFLTMYLSGAMDDGLQVLLDRYSGSVIESI